MATRQRARRSASASSAAVVPTPNNANDPHKAIAASAVGTSTSAIWDR